MCLRPSKLTDSGGHGCSDMTWEPWRKSQPKQGPIAVADSGNKSFAFDTTVDCRSRPSTLKCQDCATGHDDAQNANSYDCRTGLGHSERSFCKVHSWISDTQHSNM